MAQPQPPVKKLVIIEEGTLVSMANNAEFLKEFPFLANLKAKIVQAGCGTCGRGQAERSAVFSEAKRTIAGLDSNKKRRLKQLFNTKSLRVTYRNAPDSGKFTELTF